jgi:hypothetical protein
MKMDRRKISGYTLILGMIFLVIGLITDNTAFSWIAIILVFISLITGGRWLRPRRRK